MPLKPLKNRENSFGENVVRDNVSQPSGHLPKAGEDGAKLWREFKSGNETAFAAIYKNNVSQLYGYGLKLVNDPDLVKDAIQDLFVQLWNSKHKLADVEAIKPYLFKSVRRKLIATAKKNRNFAIKKGEIDIVAPSQELRLIEKQMFDQRKAQLRKVMLKLTDRQREIVHLKFYEQLGYAEIAEIMSLSSKATYKLMGRAIKLLRENMKCMVFLASLC